MSERKTCDKITRRVFILLSINISKSPCISHCLKKIIYTIMLFLYQLSYTISSSYKNKQINIMLPITRSEAKKTRCKTLRHKETMWKRSLVSKVYIYR